MASGEKSWTMDKESYLNPAEAATLIPTSGRGLSCICVRLAWMGRLGVDANACAMLGGEGRGRCGWTVTQSRQGYVDLSGSPGWRYGQ